MYSMLNYVILQMYLNPGAPLIPVKQRKHSSRRFAIRSINLSSGADVIEYAINLINLVNFTCTVRMQFPLCRAYIDCLHRVCVNSQTGNYGGKIKNQIVIKLY